MPCLCEYCQDTLFVDKQGNPKGEHKGMLLNCPVCQKDKKIELPKLDINIDDVIKKNARLKAAWSIELLPTWPQEHVDALVEKFKLMVISKNKICPAMLNGKTKDEWYRVEFHGSMPFHMIKAVLDHLSILPNEYRFVIDTIGTEGK